MKNNVVLCICISTYNRSEKIERIVKEILKCTSDKLGVVVVDDHSTDDTILRLNHISDYRLQIYKNTSNLGAKGNWYETINKGDGKYLLHLLDRDWINFLYLEKLIEILERENCGFGYVGSMFSKAPVYKEQDGIIERYSRGLEAMNMFACTLVHPSGVIVKRECWKALKDKKKFFSSYEYGIYPHSYLFALLAQREDGIRVNYRMIQIFSMDNYAKYPSRFYKRQKENMAYWWTPKAHQWEMQRLTDFL